MYTVTWRTDAEALLLEILAEKNFAPAVLADLKRLDEGLAWDPLSMGTARMSSVNRMWAGDWLMAEFEVIVDDLRVIVHDVSIFPDP